MIKSKKILLLVLSVLFVFTSLSIGCNNDSDPTIFRQPLTVDNSQNHIRTMTETNDYIIQNGQTNYKIVIPADADSQTVRAANELFNFTREAIDLLLDIITDDKVVEGEDKYISLGDTTLAKQANLTIDYDKLGQDGYQIKTVGKTVFVLGYGYGCKHGAYDLLKDWFNYEYYFIDCWSLDSNLNVKLKNYDITEIPDIDYRAGGFASMWTNQDTISRFKMRIYPEFFIKIRGNVFHNSFNYLPPAEHLEAHPDWYNTARDQICYTAHGNEAEYNAMVTEIVRVLKEELIAQRDLNLVTFSIQDNHSICNCDKCLEVTQEYGTNSAQIVLLLNDVNRQIKAWFADDGAEYKRDLKLCFFAYFSYVHAPATYNEQTGKYEPNKGLRCDDGVTALIAPIGADYTESFDAIENKETKEAMLGWQAVTDNIATWFYDTLYVSMQGKFVLYNTFNGFQNRFQYAYDAGSIWMFNQGNDATYGGQTVFCNLKCYLSSKFGWNVNEDYKTLVDNFFDNMYKDASGIMKTYFEELQAHFQYIKDKYSESGDCFAGWDKPEYWPKNSVLRWKDYLNQAVKAIEPLKEIDADLYETTYIHIASERMSVNFLLCNYYEGHLSSEYFQECREQFRDDVLISENNTYERVLQQWGLA